MRDYGLVTTLLMLATFILVLLIFLGVTPALT